MHLDVWFAVHFGTRKPYLLAERPQEIAVYRTACPGTLTALAAGTLSLLGCTSVIGRGGSAAANRGTMPCRF